MQALVTGGAGFIGSTLVDRLLAEGHSVDVVDDLSTRLAGQPGRGPGRPRPPAQGPPGRHPRRRPWSTLIGRRQPEVVFHLAAQADVRVSVARPVLDAEINVIGSLNVLEGARRAGARKVVFASSGGTIYGEPAPSELPVKESHPQQPLSPYGVAKKVVADYLHVYRELLPTRVHVAGPGQRLRAPPGPARRGRRRGDLRRAAARRGSRARSSATASRPATSSTSTTSSTPSSGPPTAAAACCATSAPASRRRSTSSTPRWPTPPASTGRAHARPRPRRRAGPQRPRPRPGRAAPRLGAVDRPRATGVTEVLALASAGSTAAT